MKKTVLSLAFTAFSICAFSQIPNPSFESWTSGQPNGWTTSNASFVAVAQSNQAHAGSSAAKVGTANVSSSVVSGFLETSFHTTTITESDSLIGWYKCNLAATGDELAVVIVMYQGSSTVALGITYFTVSQSTYTRFAAGCMTFVQGPIDSIAIEFDINNSSGDPDINSYAIVDDLHMGSAKRIHEQQNEVNLFVFPNPSSSLVRFTNLEDATLEIYSAEGKLLMSRLQDKGDAELDLSGLPEGLLLLVLRNDNQVSDCKIYHTL
ncbi:hypothetical protein BH11BAC7_BH11BAC7_18930 [soil metagenome]